MCKFFVKIFIFLFIALPVLSQAASLSSSDIDRYLKSYPLVSDMLGSVTKKIEKDKKLGIKLAMAQMEGHTHRQMIDIIKGWPEQGKLSELVKKQGFKSLEDWALVSDRIGGVIMSASWVMSVATMGGPPLREDMNLFAYLDDTKNELSLRKKYKSQLDEMCEKLCFEKADLDIVRDNYTKISSVLNKK